MDQSRRAVEAYWRSRMVDVVTADEDKVAPVYKLEEICELLRTSPAAIVKEVSDYILKRLDHKSPTVKQKAVRLIKYSVGKSGNEFRREMQRHSAAIRQLIHYKGQLHPLKGDALNKAVRDTANDAIAAVFSSDDNKAGAPIQGLDKRIQGFGNTNFEVPNGEKRSFISEVVGLGSASIKHGLNTIAAAHSSMKNDTGTYKSPTLRRSLTTEIDSHNEYERNQYLKESWETSTISRNTVTWSPGTRLDGTTSASNDDTSPSNTGIKTREEKLLETIVTSGGVRLQPTRDALQAFLAEATKLDGVVMSQALEMKLHSHLWQVRMKAICVLESILRKKDDEQFFGIISSYFSENKDSVVKCTELPQVSLREKAIKVLSLICDEQTYGEREQQSNGKARVSSVVQMPDLIDTSEFDDYTNQTSMDNQGEQSAVKMSSGSLVDDLFGNDSLADLSTSDKQNQDDPFADVSFHMSEKEPDDLFSGMTVDPSKSDITPGVPESKKTDLLDVFGGYSEQLQEDNVNDLMAGLSLNGMTQENEQPGAVGSSGGALTGFDLMASSSKPSQISRNGATNGNLDLDSAYSQAPMQYDAPPNAMFNPGILTQPMNYAAMTAFTAQQQFLMQNLGNINSAFAHTAGSAVDGSYSMPHPDVFQLSSNPAQIHASVMKGPKEDTKAFDFISDHIASARGSKRVS